MTNVRHSSMPKACQSDRPLETIVAPRYPWCPGLVTLKTKKGNSLFHSISSTIGPETIRHRFRVNDFLRSEHTQKKGNRSRNSRPSFLLPQTGIFPYSLYSTEFMWWKECCEDGGEQLQPVAFFQDAFKGQKKKTFGKKTNRGLWREEQVLGLQGLFHVERTAGFDWIIPPAAKENIRDREGGSFFLNATTKIVGIVDVQPRVTPQHRCHLNCNWKRTCRLSQHHGVEWNRYSKVDERGGIFWSGATFASSLSASIVSNPIQSRRLQMFFKSTTGSFSCVCQLRRSHSHTQSSEKKKISGYECDPVTVHWL